MNKLPPKRDEEDVIKDALVWAWYYTYSLALSTLIVLGIIYILNLITG